MKNFLIFIAISIFATSCAIPNSPAGGGIFFTESAEVIYYDPYIRPQQKATLCDKNILGFSFGDSSYDALKLNSSIRKIATMERTYSSRIALFSKSCLIVKGE